MTGIRQLTEALGLTRPLDVRLVEALEDIVALLKLQQGLSVVDNPRIREAVFKTEHTRAKVKMEEHLAVASAAATADHSAEDLVFYDKVRRLADALQLTAETGGAPGSPAGSKWRVQAAFDPNFDDIGEFADRMGWTRDTIDSTMAGLGLEES